MPNFGAMTGGHFLYIPTVLLLGLITGYMLGARAQRAETLRKQKRLKE